MPPNAHECVINWLRAEYKVEWMKTLIAKIQHFISTTQFSQDSSDVSKKRCWIASAVRVLSMISECIN